MYKFLTNPNAITHLDLSGTECALENVSLETNSIYREIFYFICKSDIFPLICAQIKSGSLNWPWSTKVLGQFVTLMCKFIRQSYLYTHIMMSLIKTIAWVMKASTDIITNIPARSFRTRWNINDNVCLNLKNCCYLYIYYPRCIFAWYLILSHYYMKS